MCARGLAAAGVAPGRPRAGQAYDQPQRIAVMTSLSSTIKFNRVALYSIVTNCPGRSMRAVSLPLRVRSSSMTDAVAFWPIWDCSAAASQVLPPPMEDEP